MALGQVTEADVDAQGRPHHLSTQSSPVLEDHSTHQHVEDTAQLSLCALPLADLIARYEAALREREATARQLPHTPDTPHREHRHTELEERVRILETECFLLRRSLARAGVDVPRDPYA